MLNVVSALQCLADAISSEDSWNCTTLYSEEEEHDLPDVSAVNISDSSYCNKELYFYSNLNISKTNTSWKKFVFSISLLFKSGFR